MFDTFLMIARVVCVLIMALKFGMNLYSNFFGSYGAAGDKENAGETSE